MMDGMDGGIREKLLSKLMDLLSMMPDKDKEDMLDGGKDDAIENSLGQPKDAKVEMLAVDAKPKDGMSGAGDDDVMNKLKGLC